MGQHQYTRAGKSEPGPTTELPLGGAPPDDPIELFTGLVAAQARHDHARARRIQAALRACGWSIMPLVRRREGRP